MNNIVLTNKTNNGIGTITLNRPDVHNALDNKLIAALTKTLEEFSEDTQIRVIMIAAAGKSFSSGADLNWMQQIKEFSERQNFKDAMHLAVLMKTLNTMKKPTIALVQGPAYGGGLGLISCCDIALAAPSAKFCFSEVKLGLIPAVISPYIVNAIGERHARRYFLTAERFNSETAVKLGLIHEIVTAELLPAAAENIANLMLSNGPDALAAVKQLLNDIRGQAIDKNTMKLTASTIAKIRTSNEGQEGIQAFLQKRNPRWISSL